MKRPMLVGGLVVFLAVMLAAGPSFAQQSKGKLPDFTIEKIYLTPGCNVVGVVKNLGPGSVPDDVWTAHTPKSAGVYLYRNGTKWGGGTIWKFDPAKNLKSPGGTATFVSNLNVSGTATIKVVLDLWNVVTEANEANNSLEVKLTCKAQGNQAGSTKDYGYGSDPPIVLPMWPPWQEPGVGGGGTPPICERCILNCMGDHTYEYCRQMCERSGRCKPIK
jgi:hypothetical protein